MRHFEDPELGSWILGVGNREGIDYKGRSYFVARRADGGGEVSLGDIRWNNEATARRTIEAMSEVEIRRRLRGALGRAPARGFHLATG